MKLPLPGPEELVTYGSYGGLWIPMWVIGNAGLVAFVIVWALL